MSRRAPLGIDDSDPWADLRATAERTLMENAGDSLGEQNSRSVVRMLFEDITGEVL